LSSSTPAISEPLIEVERLIKYYGRIRALDDVTLAVRRGVTGLLGPNGSGKSTLIKVLLGLARITAGRGSVLGLDVRRQVREIRHRVGYMPEDDCYIAGMSGAEAVQFAARLSGLPSTEALRRAHEILDFCDAGQERYRPVETYSTGMRQKLKFAQAIVHDPPLVILDEPTSGLDPHERQAMLRRVRILARKAGKSVIVSTHILPDVQSICDDVIILSRGKVVLSRPLEELSRPSAPTFQVRVSGPPEPLAEHIRREGLSVEIDGKGVLTVGAVDGNAVDGEAAACVWRCAQAAGVTVNRLERARNSLEQIFLEAVRGESHAHS
jgi:ABC-2 type transport system ATP-binding protein